jgi:hypothetical protein
MLKKILFWIVLAIGVILVLGSLVVYRAYRTGALQNMLVNKVTETLAERAASSTAIATAEQASFIKKMLGFDGVKTYLILLLNNTELRPGGGFIGSYAVITLDNGVPHIEKVEGTEILDYSGYPENFPSVPPDALATYLSVPRWYFRDANWSPDFASSAVKALDLYHKQRGVAADSLDGIIGVTATSLEELLSIMGSVTVQGETFSSENVVEKLEYEVEVAFAQKGLERRDRKQILGELVRSVVKKMATDVFSHWREYFTLGQKLLNEKHVIVYSIYPDEQKVLEEKKWTGTVSKHIDGDYMLWVDANLGALKTDAVMKRALTYTLRPSGTTYIGTATMRYAHTGGRDWKTSRYLTYVRIYLPYGTRLISASGMEKNARGVRTTTLDTGTEFGRTWYGGFASIEPGSTVSRLRASTVRRM